MFLKTRTRCIIRCKNWCFWKRRVGSRTKCKTYCENCCFWNLCWIHCKTHMFWAVFIIKRSGRQIHCKNWCFYNKVTKSIVKNSVFEGGCKNEEFIVKTYVFAQYNVRVASGSARLGSVWHGSAQIGSVWLEPILWITYGPTNFGDHLRAHRIFGP